jgi:hypothetical protein
MPNATGPTAPAPAPEPSPVSVLGDLSAREAQRSAVVAELLGQRDAA